MATLFKNGKNYSGKTIKLDTTLSVSGQAADAKAVGDAINVRVDKETGYLEVLKDGVWEPTKLQAIVNGKVLFSENNNAVNFVAYSGNTNEDTITAKAPTFTFGQKMTATFDANPGLFAGCIISDLVDVTDYTKIVLNHESTASATTNWEWAKLFVVSSKSSKMSALAKTTILQSQSSTSGTIELDISSVSGQVYIGIEMCSNAKVVTVNVSEMHLE